MIQIGWLVSDSQLILNLKTKIAINVGSSQNIAICYKAIRNMVLTRIVASLITSMHKLVSNSKKNQELTELLK